MRIRYVIIKVDDQQKALSFLHIRRWLREEARRPHWWSAMADRILAGGSRGRRTGAGAQQLSTRAVVSEGATIPSQPKSGPHYPDFATSGTCRYWSQASGSRTLRNLSRGKWGSTGGRRSNQEQMP
jgi:hypothetical protein